MTAYDRPLTPPTFDGPLAEGTIGWASDGGNAIDLGDTDNDGNTLVRVTLFRGRDATAQPQQAGGIAQGQELLCRVQTSLLEIPVYGSRVLVAIPEPWGMAPGGPVILCRIDAAAWKAFGNAVPGDKFIMAGAGQGVMKIGANGAWAFKTSSDGTATGPTIAASFGPFGFQFTSPWASVVGGKQPSGAGATGWFFQTAWGSFLKIYGAGGAPGLPSSLRSIIKATAGVLKLDSSQILQGPDLPGTQFVPTAAGLDPGGQPLLSALLTALAPFIDALQAVTGPLGANPAMTGVSPAQVAAVAETGAALQTAITATATILTTDTVKVSSPLP
jgi:hypothetical protein